MSPPRRRTKDRDLPPRMYRKNGAFWHVVKNKWHRLASLDDPVTAFARYADREACGRGQSLSDAINRFVAEHVPTLAPGSRKDYQAMCMTLNQWGGHLQLDEISTRHVAQFLDKYPSPGRANKIIAVLSSIYSRAIRWGWTDANPCTGVPRNKRARKKHVPSHDELQALRATLPPARQAAFDLALCTALRLGDMLALRRSDCTAEGLRAKISKTDNVVVYQWTPELRDIVDRLKGGAIASVFLIPNQRGQRYTVSGWESNWQRAKKRAGFAHIEWRDLRARALTDAKLRHGRDYAQALAAHADGSTTERYIRDRAEIVVRPLDRVEK